jgi:hypothetical protein
MLCDRERVVGDDGAERMGLIFSYENSVVSEGTLLER